MFRIFQLELVRSAKLSSQVIVLALKDGKIYSGEFRNISFKGYLSKNENIEGKADSLIIKGFDVVHNKVDRRIVTCQSSVGSQSNRPVGVCANQN